MPSSFRALVATGLAFLLAGCTVGPDFEHPAPPAPDAYTGREETLPAGPQNVAAGQSLSGAWWTRFASPGLDDVVRQALTDNQTLAVAQSTLKQSLELVTAAGGARYPQVDFAAGVTRQKINLASSGIIEPSPVFNFYQAGPSVSYALDVFGGTRRQIEEQSALAERESYRLGAAYLSLTGQVVTQALTAASIRAQIQAVEDIVADDRQNLELVRKARAAGAVAETEVVRADSQLAGDQTLLPPLYQRQSVVCHALALLVGTAPSQWTPPTFDLADFTLPADLPVSLPSELVHQRPDILAAEAEVHAASAAVGVATAHLYPDITLSASLVQGAFYPGHLWTDLASNAVAGAGLNAPLFSGGTLEAQRQAAMEAYQASLANYKQTVLMAFTQVADVLQALQHDSEAIDAQGKALTSSEASLRLNRLSFTEGNTGVLQVLDAERLYQQARLGYADAQAKRLLDTAQLFLAMGGGWRDWTTPADH